MAPTTLLKLLRWALPIVIFGIGIGVTFAMQVLVSRAIGPAAFGAFSVVYASCAIGSAAGAGGHDMAALRFATIYSRTTNRSAFRAYAGQALRDMRRWLPFALIGTVVWLLLDNVISPLLLAAAAVVTLGWGLARVGCALLRADGKIALSLVPDRIVREGSVLIVAIAAALRLVKLDLGLALLSFAIGSIVAAAVCLVLLRFDFDFGSGAPSVDRRAAKWRAGAAGLLLLNLAELVHTRGDTLTMSMIAPAVDVAYLNYALITATILAIPQLALNTIFMPLLARAHLSPRANEMRRLSTAFGVLSFVMALPFAATISIVPHQVLRLFGAPHDVPGLIEGMLWLVAARLVTLPLAAAMPIAMMTGRQLDALRVFASLLVVKVVLVAMGYLLFGVFGACVASAVSLVLLCIAQLAALAMSGGWYGTKRARRVAIKGA